LTVFALLLASDWTENRIEYKNKFKKDWTKYTYRTTKIRRIYWCRIRLQVIYRQAPSQNPEEIPAIDSDCGVQGGILEIGVKYGKAKIKVTSESNTFIVSCLFVFLALQPLWLYFHSPVAGFSLLVFEVSWSHTTTRHIR